MIAKQTVTCTFFGHKFPYNLSWDAKCERCGLNYTDYLNKLPNCSWGIL